MRAITVDFYCSEARVAVLIGQPPQFHERVTRFLSALDVKLIAVSAGEVESDPVAAAARIAATCRRARSRRKSVGAARLQSRKVKSGRSPSRHEAQKIRLRCRWCVNEWVSPWNAADPCRRCRRTEWDQVCSACALHLVEMGSAYCSGCAAVRSVVSDEVGSQPDEFRSRKHRVRKVAKRGLDT